MGVYKLRWKTENLNIVWWCYSKDDRAHKQGKQLHKEKYLLNWEMKDMLILAKDKEENGEGWRAIQIHRMVCGKKWIRRDSEHLKYKYISYMWLGCRTCQERDEPEARQRRIAENQVCLPSRAVWTLSWGKCRALDRFLRE